MKKKTLLLLSVLSLSACETSGLFGVEGGRSAIDVLSGISFDLGKAALSNEDISAAFRQALQMGSTDVTGRLGAAGGFFNDPAIKIPLPEKLANLQGNLKKVGLSFVMDDLEKRINRGAELAMPHAKEIFLNSISQMTFKDVMEIYRGAPDSATQFFKRTATPMLMEKIKPSAYSAISSAGVFQALDTASIRYPVMTLLPDPKNALTDYVTQKSLDGVFFYLAREEAAIRQDPIRHTTELLKKVFGRK